MGYTTSVEGEIIITPPLNAKEIRHFHDLTLNQGRRSLELDVKPQIETKEIETEEGVLQRQTCAVLVPWKEDPFTVTDMETSIRMVVDAFGDTHSIAGVMEGHGERRDDMWRVHVEPIDPEPGAGREGRHRVVTVKAEIHWPELPAR